jgi:hypothetical protein
MSKTVEYRTWKSMIQRCYNPAHKSFKDYGGRGISVCGQWRNSVHCFIADMGSRPDGTSIDRIDVNGNYEPDNCRWATLLIQGANQRSNRVLTINGRSQHLQAWARELGVCETTVVKLANGIPVIPRGPRVKASTEVTQ